MLTKEYLQSHAKKYLQKHNEAAKILSEEDIVTVIELYEDGFSAKEISIKVGCSKPVILKALKDTPKRKPGEYLQHFSKRQGFGETHHTWKGGYKSIYDRIRDLKSYWDWRTSIINRDNYCTKCGKRAELEVHHKQTLKNLVDLYCSEHNKLVKELTEEDLNSTHFYDVTNGVTYCKDCHREYHRIYGRD